MAKRGRKGYLHELKMRELVDMSYTQIKKLMKSKKKEDEHQKNEVAIKIISKVLPSNVDLSVAPVEVEHSHKLDFSKMNNTDLMKTIIKHLNNKSK